MKKVIFCVVACLVASTASSAGVKNSMMPLIHCDKCGQWFHPQAGHSCSG